MSLPLRPERPDLAPLEALEQLLPPQHTASSAKPGSVHELLRARLRRMAAHEGTPGHRAHRKDAPLTDGQAAERYVEACLRLLPAASAALNAAEAKRGAAKTASPAGPPPPPPFPPCPPTAPPAPSCSRTSGRRCKRASSSA